MGDFITKRMNELNWGFWVLNKVQMGVSIFILGGVYDFPLWFTVSLVPAAFVVMLIVGWFFDKYIREGYLKKQFKGVIK